MARSLFPLRLVFLRWVLSVASASFALLSLSARVAFVFVFVLLYRLAVLDLLYRLAVLADRAVSLPYWVPT